MHALVPPVVEKSDKIGDYTQHNGRRHRKPTRVCNRENPKMILSDTAKLFAYGSIAGILVAAPYFGYKYHQSTKDYPSHQVLLPALPDDCPTCSISMDGNVASVTLGGKDGPTTVSAKIVVVKDPAFPLENGSYKSLQFVFDNQITRISFFGTRLKVGGKPVPIDRSVSLNKSGLRNGVDGFGYVLMPDWSVLKGMNGVIPVLWVLRERES